MSRSGEIQTSVVTRAEEAQKGFRLKGIVGHRYGPGLWLLLAFLTAGLATLVWLVLLQRDLRRFDQRLRASPLAAAIGLTVTLAIAVLAPMGWTAPASYVVQFGHAGAMVVLFAITGGQIRGAQRAAGLQPTCSPLLGVLLLFLFLIGIFYLQRELNKVWDHCGCPQGSVVPLLA